MIRTGPDPVAALTDDRTPAPDLARLTRLVAAGALDPGEPVAAG
jgi:hypothetical protein